MTHKDYFQYDITRVCYGKVKNMKFSELIRLLEQNGLKIVERESLILQKLKENKQNIKVKVDNPLNWIMGVI